MAPTPDWVKKLTPSSPQGSDLLKAEREKSNISVEKLSSFLFTKEVIERQERILNVLKADKAFDKSQNYFDGRAERWQTALARAKRMRQLEVEYKWDRDELAVAYDLISEPGPYGLHLSMYLVSRASDPMDDCPLTTGRQHFVIKEPQSSTNSSSNPLKRTKPLGATHKQNWDMARMSEDSKLLRHGILRTRHSSSIPRISQHRSGGLAPLAGQRTMLLSWHN